MEKKLKRVIAHLLSVLMLVCTLATGLTVFGVQESYADDITIDVSNGDELKAAFEQATQTPGEYVVNIKGSCVNINNLQLNNAGSTLTLLNQSADNTSNYIQPVDSASTAITVLAGTLNLGRINDIENSHVTINAKSEVGYGSLIYINGGTVNMYEGSLIKNREKSNDGSPGGAVRITHGTFNMYGGTIRNCKTENRNISGGAIGLMGSNGECTFNMQGGEITGCEASVGGGAIFVNNSYCVCNIKGGNITNCIAPQGGAISNSGGTINISDSANISQNSNGSASNTYGGAVFNMKTLNINGGVIESNSSVYGGAIANYGGSVKITGGGIRNNTAASSGGGIWNYYYGNNPGKVTIEGGSATLNNAPYGGGIYSSGSTNVVEMTAGTLSQNSATYGGGIYVASGTFTLSGSDAAVSNNTAASNADNQFAYGGGIYNGGTLQIKKGEISGNQSKNNVSAEQSVGGGIYNKVGGSGTMTGGTVKNNLAYYGGGLMNCGSFTITGGEITSNTANQGGGAYNGKGSNYTGLFTMSGTAKLHNNKVVEKGAGSDLATEINGTDNLNLIGAASMNESLTISGKAITGWYEDGRIDEAGNVIENTRYTVNPYSNVTDLSSTYNTVSFNNVLYLIAAHGQSFTLTYDKNCDDTVSGMPDSESYDITGDTAGESHTFTLSTNEPAREGYTFKGWSLAAGSTETVTEATAYNTEEGKCSVTVYAVWEIIPNTFTVTFNTNGGSAIDPLIVEEGNKATRPADPTRSGYTFSGWYSDSALTGAFDFDTAITSDITLYAKWTENGSGGGGSGGGSGGGGGNTDPSAHTHIWGETTYTWSEDNRTCTATRTCTECGVVETETVKTASEITKEPTGTENGETTYTAKFENPAFKEQKKTVADIPSRIDQMGEDGTALGRGASFEAADKAIKGLKTDSDPAGSRFGLLKAKSIKRTTKSVKVQWTKPTGAVKYVVYGNRCNSGGKKYKMKKLKVTTKQSINFKKIAGKKVRKNTYYKFIVLALDENNNVVSTSKVIHAGSKGKKSGNPKKITVKKPVKLKKTLKAGQIFRIRAKQIDPKNYTVKRHIKVNGKRTPFRYESSNTAIAKVTKTGKITAKAPGTCKIWVYAQNGIYRTIKLTVK